jgi:hypothetical protein
MPADEQLHGAIQTAFCCFLFTDNCMPLHVRALVFAQRTIAFNIIPIHYIFAEVVNQRGLAQRVTVVRSKIKFFRQRVGERGDASCVAVPIAFKLVG